MAKYLIQQAADAAGQRDGDTALPQDAGGAELEVAAAPRLCALGRVRRSHKHVRRRHTGITIGLQIYWLRTNKSTLFVKKPEQNAFPKLLVLRIFLSGNPSLADSVWAIRARSAILIKPVQHAHCSVRLSSEPAEPPKHPLLHPCRIAMAGTDLTKPSQVNANFLKNLNANAQVPSPSPAPALADLS